VDLILNTPGMFCVLGGDVIDNHIKHLAAVIASSMPASQQWEWLQRIIKKLLPKLVAIVGGNHEAWTVSMTGLDLYKYIAKLLAVPYDADEITLNAKMKGVSYVGTIRHKYRFNSTFNPEHSVRRLWELGDDDFDFGVVCDKHVATVAPFVRHRRERWVIRPGTYQTNSKFAKSVGFHGALAVTPAIILMPGQRDLHGFARLDWAARTLAAMRAV
jgi:hypothetical protein